MAIVLIFTSDTSTVSKFKAKSCRNGAYFAKLILDVAELPSERVKVDGLFRPVASFSPLLDSNRP